MPHDVTTHIFLEDIKPNSMGQVREVLALSSLDEGFDRPYWYDGQKDERLPRRVEIPKSWSTVLVDGIMHVLVSYDKNLREFFNQVYVAFRDEIPNQMDGHAYANLVISILNNLEFPGLELSIVAHEGSSALSQAAFLKTLRIPSRIFSQR